MTYTVLDELECALVLVYAKELNGTLLVWGKTSDLTDDIADQLDTLGDGLHEDRNKIYVLTYTLNNVNVDCDDEVMT